MCACFGGGYRKAVRSLVAAAEVPDVAAAPTGAAAAAAAPLVAEPLAAAAAEAGSEEAAAAAAAGVDRPSPTTSRLYKPVVGDGE